MDYHRNSNHLVAARLFGWEHKPELPENRQLDPCFDRYRRYPHPFETNGDHLVLDLRLVEKSRGGLPGRLYIHIMDKPNKLQTKFSGILQNHKMGRGPRQTQRDRRAQMNAEKSNFGGHL